MDKPLSPCPDCGAAVEIFVQAEGARGETRSYYVECPTHGVVLDELPANCDGRRASAIRDWNKRCKTRGASHG